MELNHQSVIQIANPDVTNSFGRVQMLTTENFLTAIAQKITHQRELQPLWLEGVDCSVLTPGQQWQNGKVRICIDFVPEAQTKNIDMSQSPLDDIRQNSGN